MKTQQKILLGTILIAMQLFAFKISNAQFDTIQRDHIIILVDGGVHSDKQEIIDFIKNNVKSICINNSQTILNNGDYISFITFGLHKEKKDFKDYFHTNYDFRKNTQDFGFMYKTYKNKNIFDTIVGTINNTTVISGHHWGFPKTARNLFLEYFQIQNISKILINRIFLFQISKNEVFGKDFANYTDELQYVYDKGAMTTFVKKSIDKLKSDFIFDDDTTILGEIMNLIVSEIRPNSKPFEITSVINIDKNLKFYKTVNGYYYNLTLRRNKDADSQYIIKKFNITLKDETGKVLIDTIFNQDINDELTIKLELPFETDESKISGDIKFWVHKNYEYFNSFVLNPYGSEMQGKKGLIHEFGDITFEENAKIWGIIPMNNVMYQIASTLTFQDNQYRAVWFWNIVFGGILWFFFWLVFIKILKRNIDKGYNARIEREANEEPRDEKIDFNDTSSNFKLVSNKKEIIVTNKKTWILPFWKYKVNYKHHEIKTNINKIPQNLIVDKENLILYKTEYKENEVSVNKITELPISTAIKSFEIGLNHNAIKDFYNFNENRSNSQKERLSFAVLSKAYPNSKETFANYSFDFELKKEQAKFELSASNFKPTFPKGIEFSDKPEYGKYKIGELILSNSSTKAFAENINHKNIIISDERIFLGNDEIQTPYIYTINSDVINFISENYRNEYIENAKNNLLENNYISEKELIKALNLPTNSIFEQQIIKKAKCIHPLYKFEKNKDKSINLTLPGKSTAIIPVYADILKIGNPDKKEKTINFDLSLNNDKEPVKQEFNFILIRNDSYSELLTVVNGKELVPDVEFEIENKYEWDKSSGDLSFLNFQIGNKAKKHSSNKAIIVKNLKFSFSVASQKINEILPESRYQFNDIFSIYSSIDNKKDLNTKNYIYKEANYFNNEGADSYTVILHNQRIKDIPNNIAKIKCEITYKYDGKDLKQSILFTISKDLGEKWLALDLGTSAIVAAFTDDIYQIDNKKMLLDLHSSLHKIVTSKEGLYYKYHKENIEEFDLTEEQVNAFIECKNNGNKKNEECNNLPEILGNMISSTIMLNEQGELDAKTYKRNIVNISPTISQIKAKTEYILPYLKSLIGTDELDGYDDYEYYTQTLYFYDAGSYAKLNKLKESKNEEFAIYLKKIEEEFGNNEYTQKQFESKLRNILKDHFYEKYKHDFIGEFTLPYENLKKELSKPEYNGQMFHLNRLKDKKFVFFNDYIYELKKLLTKQNTTTDEFLSESEINTLIRDKQKHEKIVANFKEQKLVKHKDENEYVKRKIKITTILQNAYESIFRDFVYPQVHQQLENEDSLTSVLNKIVLSYPNTFSPLHIKHIKEDVILQQFPEFDKNHIKFISESDAVAMYYAGNKYDKAKPEYVLVYDMGAGTLDITYFYITRKDEKTNINIIGKSGKTTAGNYLDRLIAEHIYLLNKDKFKTKLFTDGNNKIEREHSIILKNYVKKIIKPNLYQKSIERQEEEVTIRENYKKIVDYTQAQHSFNNVNELFKDYTDKTAELKNIQSNLEKYKSVFDAIRKSNTEINEINKKITKIENLEKNISDKEAEIYNILEKLNVKNIQELKNSQVDYDNRQNTLALYAEYTDYKRRKEELQKLGTSIEDIEKTINDIKNESHEKLNEIYKLSKTSSIEKFIDKAKFVFEKSESLFEKLKLNKQVTDEVYLEEFIEDEKGKVKKFENEVDSIIKSFFKNAKFSSNDTNRKLAIIINHLNNETEYVAVIKKELAQLQKNSTTKQIKAGLTHLENKKSELLAENSISENSENEWKQKKDTLHLLVKELRQKLYEKLNTKNENTFESLINEKGKKLTTLLESISISKTTLKEMDIKKAIDNEKLILEERLKKIDVGENIIYVSKETELIREIIEIPFDIDLNELVKSDTIQNYIEQNTLELMNEFYNVYKFKIKTVSGNIDAFPIDKIILSGRGSQLTGLRQRLETIDKNGSKHWKNQNNIEFPTFAGENEDELKTIVTKGALYYAMQLNSGRSDFAIQSDNLNAIYGVLYKRKYEWEFLPLLYPGMSPLINKPDVKNGFWLYRYLEYVNFDFHEVTNFQLIQTYVANPQQYIKNERQEYYTKIQSYSVAKYAKNIKAGIGIEIDSNDELHFYIYNELIYKIPFDFINQLRNNNLPDEVINCFQDIDKNMAFSKKEDMANFIKHKMKNKYNEYTQIILKCTIPSSGVEATKLEMSKLNKLTENKTFKYSVWPYLS